MNFYTENPPVDPSEARKAPAQASKMTTHLQEDQQEEAKSTDWLESPGQDHPTVATGLGSEKKLSQFK